MTYVTSFKSLGPLRIQIDRWRSIPMEQETNIRYTKYREEEREDTE